MCLQKWDALEKEREEQLVIMREYQEKANDKTLHEDCNKERRAANVPDLAGLTSARKKKKTDEAAADKATKRPIDWQEHTAVERAKLIAQLLALDEDIGRLDAQEEANIAANPLWARMRPAERERQIQAGVDVENELAGRKLELESTKELSLAATQVIAIREEINSQEGWQRGKRLYER